MLLCITCPQCRLEFLVVPREDDWVTCPRCGAEGPAEEAETTKPHLLVWAEEIGYSVLIIVLASLTCWPVVCAGFLHGTLLPFALLCIGLGLLRVGHRGLALAVPRRWALAGTWALGTLLVASWLVLMLARFAGD